MGMDGPKRRAEARGLRAPRVWVDGGFDGRARRSVKRFFTVDRGVKIVVGVAPVVVLVLVRVGTQVGTLPAGVPRVVPDPVDFLGNRIRVRLRDPSLGTPRANVEVLQSRVDEAKEALRRRPPAADDDGVRAHVPHVHAERRALLEELRRDDVPPGVRRGGLGEGLGLQRGERRGRVGSRFFPVFSAHRDAAAHRVTVVPRVAARAAGVEQRAVYEPIVALRRFRVLTPHVRIVDDRFADRFRLRLDGVKLRLERQAFAPQQLHQPRAYANHPAEPRAVCIPRERREERRGCDARTKRFKRRFPRPKLGPEPNGFGG